jgi:cyclophilin family peptidyl-prolyl cis-trans isomerase
MAAIRGSGLSIPDGCQLSSIINHAIPAMKQTILSLVVVILGMAGTVNAGAQPLKAVATQTVIMKTSMGDITIELYGKDAPKTVANFVGLAKKGFYNGILFHRVIPGFMIQGGDPKSRYDSLREEWGTGGESIYGENFADEIDPNSRASKLGYSEGVVAMANAGPNTNGSQFFIVASTEGTRHLSLNYTIFGRVVKGMDVVHKIEKTGLQGEIPVQPASILSITVKEAGR